MGREPEHTFLLRCTQMAKRHIKRCSASLIIGKMQIQTTVTPLTPVRMAIIDQSASDSEEVEWREPQYTVGRIAYWYSHYGRQYGSSSKIKNRTTMWPSKFASEYLSEEIQNVNFKKHMLLYVHCSVIYNCQDMEATEVSTGRWLDKEDVVHIYNRILLIHKKRKKSCYSQQHG